MNILPRHSILSVGFFDKFELPASDFLKTFETNYRKTWNCNKLKCHPPIGSHLSKNLRRGVNLEANYNFGQHGQNQKLFETKIKRLKGEKHIYIYSNLLLTFYDKHYLLICNLWVGLEFFKKVQSSNDTWCGEDIEFALKSNFFQPFSYVLSIVQVLCWYSVTLSGCWAFDG